MTPTPEWKNLLEKAKAENDPDKLVERVLNAEGAILARVMEVCDMKGHAPELAELKVATAELRQIQVNRLGYPDIKPNT
jgi:hypothetical protein